MDGRVCAPAVVSLCRGLNSEFADLPARANDHEPLIAGIFMGQTTDRVLAFDGQGPGRGVRFDAGSNTVFIETSEPGIGRLLLDVVNTGDTLILLGREARPTK